jgi:hypothetical protein
MATGGGLNAMRRGVNVSNVQMPKENSLPINPIRAELPGITEQTTQLIP